MDTFVDYYELLHVQPSAPGPVIKASYRTMMQKLNHHPDRGGEVGFAQLLNDAVKTLCDPKTRAQYDALRKQFASASGEHPRGASESSRAWGEPGGSPNRPADQPTDSQKTEQDARTRQRYADSQPGGSTQSARDYATLPSQPQCPFCRSIYSSDAASMTTLPGYAHSRRCHSCNGARTPIAHLPRTSNEELRKMHRQLHETDAQLFLEWPCEAPLSSQLTDFSPAGCALVYSTVIDVGQMIMIETDLFNAICTVRHCKDNGHKGFFIGLEFVTLDMLAGPGTLLSATA